MKGPVERSNGTEMAVTIRELENLWKAWVGKRVVVCRVLGEKEQRYSGEVRDDWAGVMDGIEGPNPFTLSECFAFKTDAGVMPIPKKKVVWVDADGSRFKVVGG